MLKKLFKESLIYGLSRNISKFIGVFLLPLYTAVLTPQDYGILDLLGTISLVSSFLIISGTDASLGYHYYRKEYELDRPIMISSALWLRIIFSFAIFIIIAFGSSFLSKLLFGKDYSLFVIITGFAIAFSSIYSFLFDLLRFEFRPWFYTLISSSGIFLQISLTIYFVLILRQGVYGALVANAIGYAFFFMVTILYVFGKYGLGISVEWFKRIFNYGFPLIGTGIAVWVLTSSGRYFLVHYADLSTVGIYSVGMKLASFLGVVSGALQLAWGPFALSIQYNEKAKVTYANVFLIVFLINIVGVFFISMFALNILKVFTQPSYYGAKAVVPFLCLSTILQIGESIVGVGIQIAKKLQHTIWITVAAAALNIILNFVLTPFFGAVGAAFSIMMANLFIFIATYLISQKYYKIPYDFVKVASFYLLTSVVLGLVYYYQLNIILKSLISLFYLSIFSIYFYNSIKKFPEYNIFINKLTDSKIYKWIKPRQI